MESLSENAWSVRDAARGYFTRNFNGAAPKFLAAIRYSHNDSEAVVFRGDLPEDFDVDSFCHYVQEVVGNVLVHSVQEEAVTGDEQEPISIVKVRYETPRAYARGFRASP